MSSPPDNVNERRAMPRHLRDGENDLLAMTGTFAQRREDGRRRYWIIAALVAVAAGAAAFFLLR